jgi:NlpC/P60 family putative phage cell wall peptidase
VSRDRVIAEARTWLGTPYHHHARVKGAGVDCAMLLAEVYAGAGVVPPVAIGPADYPHDWHLHRSEELYVAWLERCGAREVQTPAPGDVALFRWGRTWSHGAILVDGGQLVHSYVGRGVILTRLDEDPLAGRVPRWYSLWGDA